MLTIPQALHDALIAHARRDFPLEACGLLGGIEGVVSAHFPMRNLDQSNEHFTLDPREQFAVVKELRARGLGMVAIYHSHPETPARPSAEDIRLALTPDVSYVIVSLADPQRPELRSYRIADGVSVEEPVTVVP